MLRFHVLGPVELRDDAGGRVPVRARKVRTLLAALLANANRRVSADALIESLWGERPPRSATANLRTYAWELRQLVPEGADRIELDGGGYRIAVDRDEFDATHFDDLAAGGHAELAAGAVHEAAVTLANAVALWRGDAFEDVAGPTAAPMASRLTEQYWAVREDMAEARLRLGEHSAVVVDLTALTREQPYRERFWEMLVVALQRCGRRGEALAAYRAVERLLGDELGIEPGAGLRAAHDRIRGAQPS